MNDLNLVDTKKVAKQVANAGEFMLLENEVGNLLVTSQFMLNLTPKNFFSIRCKLEVPDLEQWYIYDKDGPVPQERPAETELWVERYLKWMREADRERVLTKTGINIGDSLLYTNGLTYTAISAERVVMLTETSDMRLADKMVVFDYMHVLAPNVERIWRDNGFLHRLPGIKKEQENEK